MKIKKIDLKLLTKFKLVKMNNKKKLINFGKILKINYKFKIK